MADYRRWWEQKPGRSSRFSSFSSRNHDICSVVSESGKDSPVGYLILDNKATWVPFFDDGAFALVSFPFPVLTACPVDAIIFLCPISGFDQVLSEDRSVNRLVSRSTSISTARTDVWRCSDSRKILYFCGKLYAQTNSLLTSTSSYS